MWGTKSAVKGAVSCPGECEEILDALALAREGRWAVTAVDRGVSLDEVRHQPRTATNSASILKSSACSASISIDS